MLHCISVNHKNADSGIRSLFAYDKEKRSYISEQLTQSGIKESVVLCTCNRSEIYYIGSSEQDRETVLKTMCGTDKEKDVGEYLRFKYGEKAVKHLFRVCCGIDSMILGEDEILGQTRDAYYEALQNGFTGYEINTVFQSAITCAKRIKTETELSRSSVSAATLAASEASSFSDNVNVLVIGSSGKIGSSVLKNLTAHKNVNVSRTIRQQSISHYDTIENVTDISYSERYSNIGDYDCIISATTSPHYTVVTKKLRENMPEGKKMLLIDLAVPPDIEGSAADIDGVRLIGIDHFRKLAEKNNLIRISSAEQAEMIISEEIDKLMKKLLFHEFMPQIENVKRNMEKLSFEEIIFELRDNLSFTEFEAVVKAFERM